MIIAVNEIEHKDYNFTLITFYEEPLFYTNLFATYKQQPIWPKETVTLQINDTLVEAIHYHNESSKKFEEWTPQNGIAVLDKVSIMVFILEASPPNET